MNSACGSIIEHLPYGLWDYKPVELELLRSPRILLLFWCQFTQINKDYNRSTHFFQS